MRHSVPTVGVIEPTLAERFSAAGGQKNIWNSFMPAGQLYSNVSTHESAGKSLFSVSVSMYGSPPVTCMEYTFVSLS